MMRSAAAPRALVRSLASPDLRRGFPKYYRGRRRVAAANVVAASLLAPLRTVRLSAALGVGTVAARLAWRARTGWGSNDGFPPGSIGSGSEAVHNPNHFFDAQRRHGSVFKTNHFDEPAVCLIGMEMAATVFQEKSEALASMPLAFNQYVPGGLVRWKRGREHQEYRRLFQHIFGQHLIRSNERILQAAIDRMLAAMHEESETMDVSPIVHLPDMVFEAWTELFFGITPDDPRFPEVSALYETIDVSRLHGPAHMVVALQRLEDILGADTTAPDDCALGLLRSRTGDQHLEKAMVRNLIFTLDMTSTDMCGLLMWALYHATTHPRVLDELALDVSRGPYGHEPRSLANRMVSETLRLEQSEHLFRRARSDITIGRYRVPAGWLVRVCTQESHRDPATFAHPDRYDPDRFLEPTWNPAAYAPFGIDGHACIGEALTRRFTSNLLVQLARNYEVEVTNDGPRQMGDFQHWAPSDDFCIRLVEREGRSPETDSAYATVAATNAN